MFIEISIDVLKTHLNYDSESGIFSWKTKRRGRNKQKIGRFDKAGYLYICIDQKTMLAHRIAWAYVHKEWPKYQIDHIDGDKKNNRIANLRDVPARTNLQNKRKAFVKNTSGFLGVHKKHIRADGTQMWGAQIITDKKHVYLGVFKDPAIAHAAYVEKKRLLHVGNTL